jgi:hypothetical protein
MTGGWLARMVTGTAIRTAVAFVVRYLLRGGR